jgi:hypothetical protein
MSLQSSTFFGSSDSYYCHVFYIGLCHFLLKRSIYEDMKPRFALVVYKNNTKIPYSHNQVSKPNKNHLTRISSYLVILD